MARRTIKITDDKRRDAEVEIETPPRDRRHGYINQHGERVNSERLIKSTENHTYEALAEKYENDEAIAEALIEEDPEIPMDRVGRRIGPTDRVWIREDGSILYCARNLMVKYDPDGNEVEREDFVDVEATVSDEVALPWTGRLFPLDTIVRRFVFARTLRVRHVNGLTFDFLYDIAKHLHEEEKALLMGSGKKGTDPLIFQTNGKPYRGFLEGRIDGDGFLLLMHLSDLELKSVTNDE